MDCSLLIFNCLTFTSCYTWCVKIKQYNNLLYLSEAEKWDALNFFQSYILGCYLIRKVDVSNIEKLGFRYGLFHDCGPNTSWLQISFFDTWYHFLFCYSELNSGVNKLTCLTNKWIFVLFEVTSTDNVYESLFCYIITWYKYIITHNTESHYIV